MLLYFNINLIKLKMGSVMKINQNDLDLIVPVQICGIRICYI